MNSTSLPQSRKYSAMVVAVSAPFKRIMASWSEVATTTTDLANPSGPKSVSINSGLPAPFADQPITLISAEVCRAIIPKECFPPLPEKIPNLWPLPQVKRPSIALTPTESGSRIIWRCSGWIVVLCSGRYSSASMGPFPSIGLPKASRTLPRSLGPTPTRSGCPRLLT